jgi:energy-converting hydrogenase Eha subunit B
MTALWQFLESLLESTSGYAATLGALLITVAIFAVLALLCTLALAGWGFFMYVRRFLGWRRVRWRG